MGSHARPDWTPEEITHLKELCDSGLYRFDKMAEALGRPRHGVMYKCYERGFQNRYRHHLYTHNKRFFSQITPETCYWAGVITTDGCLTFNKAYPHLVLVTAIVDFDHVERFKAAMQATNPISRHWSKCGLSTSDTEALHEHCRIDIAGAGACFEDLGKVFNITPNKTLRGNPPVLPTAYHQLCFIRGFIDGDGSVTHSNQLGFMSIQVCGCNREMIAWVKDTIDSIGLPSLSHRGPSLLQQPKDENCYYHHIRGLAAAVLYELLRRLPLPRLSRKWDNPNVIPHVAYWKEHSSNVWPPESWFEEILTAPPAVENVNTSISTPSTPTHRPPPPQVYPLPFSVPSRKFACPTVRSRV